MSRINRQFRLKRRPEGLVERADFDFVETPAPEPGPGEALVRTLYLSLDPTNRIWMSDRDQYMPPVELGAVMRGGGIGQIVASKREDYPVGSFVSGLVGWQDYSLVPPGQPHFLGKLPPNLPVPLTAMLSGCGGTGLTAYFGLLRLGDPQPGETVVVSAAAGAVGSIVGQIAKIKGARAVGIAGGPEKCQRLVEHFGFDAAVDYKSPDWLQQLAVATPDGVQVNFENVGGEVMEAVMARMTLGGRMPLCGMISGYNAAGTVRNDFSPILMKRLRVQGFIVVDFAAEFAQATAELIGWTVEGRLRFDETIVEGLETAPEAVNMLFDGRNMGKLIVKVADPD